MSWNDGGVTNGFTADEASSAWGGGDTSGGVDFTANAGGDVTAEGGFGGDDCCRNCGQSGHFSRDCPEPSKMTGECYNCGEVGHNKADCTNAKVDRPFTGTCRVCNQEGHRAADCPDKPAELCRLCQQSGHKAMDCTALRKDVFGDFPEISAEDAWKAMETADKEKDMDDFKIAFFQYAKALDAQGEEMAVNLADLETGFRAENRNVYLIAKEREMIDTMTIISLAGKIDQEFVLTFNWSAKARRGKFAEGWPSTPEENLERLQKAGIPCDRGIPKCDQCGELGHIKKHCKQEEVEGAEERVRVEVKCMICNEVGHRARDCKQERTDPFACRNCKQSGHQSNECPEPRSAEGVECRVCSKMGHFSKDCPDKPPPMACRNCGEEGHKAADCVNERVLTCRNCLGNGHMSRDCPEPKNPANAKCMNCETIGHFSRDCPKPRDYSKITCKRCGEKGHTVVRCKQPEDASGEDGGFGNSGLGESTDASAGADAGGWASGGGGFADDATVTASGGW